MQWRLRCVIAALVWIASPALAAGPPADAAATVDAFHEALRLGDEAAAAALLAEDALIFEEGGAERSRAEYVEKHLGADAAFSKAVSSRTVRRRGGGDAAFAWVASEGRVTGNYKGQAVNRLTTESMLLRHEGTSWRIVHIHWSSGPAR